MGYPRKGPTRITGTKLIKLDLLGCEGPATTILVTNTLTAELGARDPPPSPGWISSPWMQGVTESLGLKGLRALAARGGELE